MLEILILVLWPVVGVGLSIWARRAFRRWPRRGALRVLVGNVCVLMAVLYFGLYAAELALRVRYGLFGTHPYDRVGRPYPFFDGDKHPYLPDPVLGWSHEPGVSGVYYGPDCMFRFRINSQGIRDTREFARTKKKPRILLLGDSFTFGHGVDDGKQWAWLLQHNLPDWEVINAAVSSYSEVQILLQLQNQWAKYAPDVVIVGHFSGMLERNSQRFLVSVTGDLWDKPHAAIEDGQLRIFNIAKVRAATTRSLLEESYLYNQLRAPSLRRRIKENMERNKPRISLDQQYKLFGALLEKIRDEVRAAGAKHLIVVYFPKIHDPGVDGPRIQNICERNQVRCLDLTGPFARHKAEHPDDLLFYPIDAHPTSLGARLIAEQVETALRDHGVLKWLTRQAADPE